MIQTKLRGTTNVLQIKNKNISQIWKHIYLNSFRSECNNDSWKALGNKRIYCSNSPLNWTINKNKKCLFEMFYFLRKLVKRFFISAYLITRILSSKLINTDFGHSTLVYLVLIIVACKFSLRLFILAWKYEPKLCEDM